MQKKSLKQVKTPEKSPDSLLKPHSIAVIGASRRPQSIGNRLFHNLLQQEFQGIVYPVNPNAEAIASVKAYPSVLDIPGDVEMAVIIVPAEGVNQVLEECGKKGVRAVVVISAGFKETGEEGAKREQQLVQIIKRYGIRLVGPNCMGVINTDPEVNMNATFSPVFPPTGNVAFATQSGALGLAILDYTQRLNIGLSSFVSIGNRADVSSNDLLEYWERDPNTDVILLYLESFGNPRKFARIARSVSALKPIVAVKSGRTPAGSRAAASHTGAMATAEVASEAMFQQAGIIRADTLEDVFDTANLLSHQPVPNGRRVAILTNGGGPGIMTADACVSRGLEVPQLSDRTRAELKKYLRQEASLNNPIDMTAEATADNYRQSLKLLVQDDNIDIAIVIFIPPIVTQTEAVASTIREVAPQFRQHGKTLVASFMGLHGASLQLGSKEEGFVPSFAFPEAAALALSRAHQYGERLKRPKGKIPRFTGTDKQKAESIIKTAQRKSMEKPVWLDPDSITELLKCYGIRTARASFAATPEEAVKEAESISYPVAVKLMAPRISHKTDVGGVILNINSASEVKSAFQAIKQRLAELGREREMQGVTIQKMVPGGTEVIVGVTQDPSFGPLLMFGMGGIFTELFKDVDFRIHPLTDVDASEMVRSVKAYKLLEGWRGARRNDIESVEELLLRVSAMVEDLPQIEEVDLNPVKVFEQGKGYTVVDARISVS